MAKRIRDIGLPGCWWIVIALLLIPTDAFTRQTQPGK
jgi:uncharacterized membrane protein YhaH (DUF805 family)